MRLIKYFSPLSVILGLGQFGTKRIELTANEQLKMQNCANIKSLTYGKDFPPDRAYFHKRN